MMKAKISYSQFHNEPAMSNLSTKKVAIVADWLTSQGGMEHVITAMSDLFPNAPIYTPIYTDGGIPSLQDRNIKTSWLQRLPLSMRKLHQHLLPFYPAAISSLDLSDYDIIISSSSAFGKCISKSRDAQIHVCYCHTPVRYLYHAREDYLKNYPLSIWFKPIKFILPKVLDYLTKKDQQAAGKVDYFISNSNYVGERIKKYYKRASTTIYPCIDTTQFCVNPKRGEHYLALGRFIPYKRFDLLVETFAKNKLPLILAGDGPELIKCKKMAEQLDAKNIEFTGYVNHKKLVDVYQKAKAFVFPAEEDFGLTPIEAMACGIPVIAYAKGGAVESVTQNSGLLFKEQTVESLQACLDQFERSIDSFDVNEIVENALRFDQHVFQQKLSAFLEKIVVATAKEKMPIRHYF